MGRSTCLMMETKEEKGMSAQVTNYQCPACTGPVHFSPEEGKVVCDYCGSVYELSEIEAIYAEKEAKAAKMMEEEDFKESVSEEDGESVEDIREGTEISGEWDTTALKSDWGEDEANMKAYNCPSCGADLVCESSTGATSCPYCGNPTVVPGQFSGTLRPNYVLPFKLDKKGAIKALKKHYKGKFLLPSSFRSSNQLKEIKGVYVPFWLFDSFAEGSATYDATKVSYYETKDEDITKTDHYRVVRAGKMSFEKIPADASTKMPDDYMDSIEPFDYQELKAFSTAYLPGFLADRYDVKLEDSWGRAEKRCEETIQSELNRAVKGYDTYTKTREWVHIERGKVHYALLPVWLLTTKWKDKTYLYAVNGQTGKTAGELPVSKIKLLALFAALSAAFSALAMLVVDIMAIMT